MNHKNTFLKPITFNFVSVIIVAVLFILAGVFATASLSLNDADAVQTDIKSKITEIHENAGEDGIDDVYGYGLVILNLGYGVATLGEAFVVATMILCGLGAFIIFFPALLARLLYKNSDGRIMVYRIIMGIDYVMIAVLALMLLGGSALLIDWLIPLAMLVIVVCGVINTYSNRIRNC